MPVVFDAVASSSGFDNVSTVSYTHTPSGTPSAVGVGISLVSTGATADITSVTYGGVTMSVADTASWTSISPSFPFRTSIYGLASPPSGAQTVVVTFANGGCFGACGSITVTGSDASTCFSNTNNAFATSGTTGTVTTTSATNELVMDSWGSATSTDTEDGSQTLRWNDISTGSTVRSAGSTKPGAASVTMTWTRSITGVDFGWGLVAASFKEAVAAISTSSTLLMMGVG